jgi:GntR family transcriptional repressor for pyruvate dehydrogenase complex
MMACQSSELNAGDQLRGCALPQNLMEFGRMGCQPKEPVVNDPFRSVARELNLSDKVTEQLTEAILSRQIPPGEKLPSERALCEKFKVSRTVVREAVRSLSARGLVRVTSGRGVEVNELGSGHVADSMRLLVRGHEGLSYGKVNEVRTALEVQTAGLAAQRITTAGLAQLEQICDDHERSLQEEDLAAAGEFDFQFHRELTRAADNDLLLGMLDSISDVLHEVRHQALTRPHVGEEGLRAHRRILKAVKSGNVNASREAMAQHLAEAERVWREGSQGAKGSPKSTSRKPQAKTMRDRV